MKMGCDSMPRIINLLNDVNYSDLIRELQDTDVLFYTSDGMVTTNDNHEIIPRDAKCIHTDDMAWVTACWYPIYDNNNNYLGYIAGGKLFIDSRKRCIENAEIKWIRTVFAHGKDKLASWMGTIKYWL